MKYLRILQSVLRKKFIIKNQIHRATFKTALNCNENGFGTFDTDRFSKKLVHYGGSDRNEELEVADFDALERQLKKHTLFPNTSDALILSLNNCASVEEVLNFFYSNKHSFDKEHFTHIILVLRDIQIISKQCYQSNYKMFGEKLLKNDQFIGLFHAIHKNMDRFNQTLLGHLLVNLNRLGVPIEHDLMQKLAMKLRDLLKDEFDINNCAQLFTAVFTENSVRPYHIVLELIPKVITFIDNCQTTDNLEKLSICLNKINKIVTNDVLKTYEDRLMYFLKNKKLVQTDHEAICEVVRFLNYPSWRDKNCILTSKCMLLLKDEMHMLKVSTFLKVFDVLYASQEPGELLNNVQRCSAKFLQQIEDGEIIDANIYLRIFASIVYFSSPTNRIKFQKDIEKLLNTFDVHNVNMNSLDLLRRVFSFLKISNKKLCEQYWDLNLEWLETHENPETISLLCQNYVHFSSDLEFRHYEFENKLLTLIHDLLRTEIIFPEVLMGILKFYLIFGRNEETMISLINRFEENITQFGALDCLKISECFKLKLSNHISPFQGKRLKILLDQITARISLFDDSNFIQNGMLLKAAISRDDYDNLLVDDLIMRYKQAEYMSSKIMENICYILFHTSTLIPEVINKCTEYVAKNQQHLTGYNVEKLLYLTYYLAYYPVNADIFFQAVTNVILRDQERLSGLSFLHCALSLSFFNKLPGYFIKQIFNVEFLDKLDTELQNCYSKEKYPQRVRTCLMHLNRTVCLEYPEYNVPWFHKKYVDEMHSRYILESDNHFQIRFKQYLMRIIGTQDKILENVVTPYGYLIDFVINFNQGNNVVKLDSSNIKRRLALLLIRPHGFTRFYSHLKGRHQMTKRHLEMFGYEVSIVKFSEWINLLYCDERTEFVKDILWPQKLEDSNTFRKS